MHVLVKENSPRNVIYTQVQLACKKEKTWQIIIHQAHSQGLSSSSKRWGGTTRDPGNEVHN